MMMTDALQGIKTIELEILQWINEDFQQLADAFLREYQRQSFVKGQKGFIHFKEKTIPFRVRELIFSPTQTNNTNVQFLYRPSMFR